jgi:hypothetical protein
MTTEYLMKIKPAFVIIILLLSIALTGCAKRAAFTYSPGAKTTAALSNTPLPFAVVVMPFEDARGRNTKNNQILCLIPFVLYCSLQYDRPEAGTRFLFVSAYTFRPSEDFAGAVADEMQRNRFFEKVIFDGRAREVHADLVVSGRIMETRYYGENASYGLSLWAPALWSVGLPAGKVHNTVFLSMEMRRSSDNVVVWSHIVRGEWSEIVGQYYHWAADFDGYPLILREGLQQGMEKLSDAVKTRDQSYWTGKQVLSK